MTNVGFVQDGNPVSGVQAAFSAPPSVCGQWDPFGRFATYSAPTTGQWQTKKDKITR